MAEEVLSLVAKVSLDDNNFKNGLKNVQSQAKSLANNVKDVFSGIGNTLNNLKMPTIPTIITTNNVLMNFENADYSFSEGEHLNTSIVLREGENIFTFKEGSSGTVTFSYQEGTL